MWCYAKVVRVCHIFTSMPLILDETLLPTTVHHSHLCGVFGRTSIVYLHDIKKHFSQKVASYDKSYELSWPKYTMRLFIMIFNI